MSQNVIAAGASEEEMRGIAKLIRAYEVVKEISDGPRVDVSDVGHYAKADWTELSDIWKEQTGRDIVDCHSNVRDALYKAELEGVNLDEPLKQILQDEGLHICLDRFGDINVCTSEDFARDVLRINNNYASCDPI